MAEKKSFLLRLSPEVWDQLNRWAADELRSVNGQIEFILRQAIVKRTGKEAQSNKSPDSTAGSPTDEFSPNSSSSSSSNESE